MAGGFPIFGGLAPGQNTITAPIFLIAAGSGASGNNIKTAYSQIVASTTHDASMLDICFSAGAGATNGFNSSWDFAIGSSGNEVIIAADLLLQNDYVDGTASPGQSPHIMLPLQIPAGSRLSTRMQVSAGYSNAACYCYLNSCDLYSSSFMACQFAAIDTIGFQSGSTTGTSVTTSASANVKGSYAQLVASTSHDYIGYFLAFDYQSLIINGELYIDIALGSSGNEYVIQPNLFQQLDYTNIRWMSSITPIYFIPIPAGSRISARAASANSTARVVGVTLYGVR